MDVPRLKSGLRIQAYVRRCTAQGLFATVARKGDVDAGVVFIKLNLLGRGFKVLAQERDLDGRLQWAPRTGDDPVPEADVDAYLDRQSRYDPDFWILEIEGRDDRLPFIDDNA